MDRYTELKALASYNFRSQIPLAPWVIVFVDFPHGDDLVFDRTGLKELPLKHSATCVKQNYSEGFVTFVTRTCPSWRHQWKTPEEAVIYTISI